MGLKEWINAYDLSCPMLKYNTKLASWIALDKDPCLVGVCNKKDCLNYLKGFSKPERLIIITKNNIDKAIIKLCN